ncbi:unnamed protein product [Diabrotica balteata]|uniref:AB hydrolase-1 domain-containing protein n=1 Tax=Diabrotica balteata TaxID=107213 RepID=A0A9N9TDB0_DIABA|nr:unnamed protein product [Diabrotica balteata]
MLVKQKESDSEKCDEESWVSPNWLSWNKYSESMLRALEKRILSILKVPYKGFYVDIGPVVGPADKIWTLSFNTESQKTPLVLLHGLGSGVALWCLNLDTFANTRPVYAIDVLGFGRSSRPTFSQFSKEAEKQMIRSIEEWRKELKLKDFILLGHSMGGFLAASYSISYPNRVKHLILADPWGFPERPREYNNIPLWIKTVVYVLKPFNPLAGIRVAGPFGPKLINTIRPDISKKYAMALEDTNLIPEYIYQCNCQNPRNKTNDFTQQYIKARIVTKLKDNWALSEAAKHFNISRTTDFLLIKNGGNKKLSKESEDLEDQNC